MIIIIFPKMIVWLSARLEVEVQSQLFLHQTYYIKKSFHTATSKGISGVVLVFYFKIHTYNYSVNGRWALILSKLETRTIINGRSMTN